MVGDLFYSSVFDIEDFSLVELFFIAAFAAGDESLTAAQFGEQGILPVVV